MYLATSPTLAPVVRTGHAMVPLRFVRAEQRTFRGGTPYVGDGLLEDYLSDMTRLYGGTFSRELFASGHRNAFTTMAATVLDELAPSTGPLDLIVIAHVTPDADPRRSTACYLTETAPGDALAFAISDQGVLAPFTALRVLGDYAGGGGAERALLLVMDQSTLPYPASPAEQMAPAEDVIVGFLLESQRPAGGIAVRPHCDADPQDLAALIAAESSRHQAPVTLIAGRGLDLERDLPLGVDEVIVAAAGRPCTGVWSAFADNLARWSVTGRQVLVADYDQDQRDLSLCSIEVAAAIAERRM